MIYKIYYLDTEGNWILSNRTMTLKQIEGCIRKDKGNNVTTKISRYRFEPIIKMLPFDEIKYETITD